MLEGYTLTYYSIFCSHFNLNILVAFSLKSSCYFLRADAVMGRYQGAVIYLHVDPLNAVIGHFELEPRSSLRCLNRISLGFLSASATNGLLTRSRCTSMVYVTVSFSILASHVSLVNHFLSGSISDDIHLYQKRHVALLSFVVLP